MNFSSSYCLGYGFRVMSPSFRDTTLKYLRQKYRTSFLHLFTSLASYLNSSGDSISFSPAFFMEASSASGSLSPLFCIYYATRLDFGFFSPRSRFSNLSIVGLSNPFYPISHHALSPLSGLGRTSFLLSSTFLSIVVNVLSYEHTEDDTIICALNLSNFSGESSFA